MKKKAAMAWGFGGCWLAPAAFVLDRGTKLLAAARLRGAGPAVVVPGVLQLTYVENTGAAFGILRGQPLLLAVVTGAALAGLLVWLALYGGRLPRWPRWAMWLLLGGAAGNLYDRLAHGAVIDFLETLLFRFPVFNVADICVCVAFAGLAVWVLFGKEARGDG